MKLSRFPNVATGLLACAVLALGGASTAVAANVKVCHDLACCKANPNAMASNGQPCSAILRKNSGHASEQRVDKASPKLYTREAGSGQASGVSPAPGEASEATTVKGSKSNGSERLTLNTNITSREGTPVPTPKPLDSINLNSSRSNIYRTMPTPTPAPVGLAVSDQGVPSDKESPKKSTTK